MLGYSRAWRQTDWNGVQGSHARCLCGGSHSHSREVSFLFTQFSKSEWINNNFRPVAFADLCSKVKEASETTMKGVLGYTEEQVNIFLLFKKVYIF